MCGLGPIVGTLLISSFWGTPELVISSDIAGVPVLFYAYITVLPVVVPASLFWCYFLSLYLKRESHGNYTEKKRKTFFVFSLNLGIIFGFIFAIFPVCSSLFSGEFAAFFLWSIAGILTGITCSLLCFPIWNKQLKKIKITTNIVN